jgi:flagellar assembly factor FliW
MATTETTQFGVLEYDPEDIIQFPQGLPAFEEETEFILVENAATLPVVFLQSLRDPGLSFITLPTLAVDPSYRLAISAEDLAALQLDPGRQPEEGREVVALAIVTVKEGEAATANLMAPVVIHRAARQGLQALQPWTGYSHRHLLQARGGR